MIVRTPFGRVGVDDAGAGVPVLLLHGFPHDRTLWRAQLAAPAPGFRYLAPDLPGFGASDLVADPASMDRWAAWAVALLDALELPRAVVGGLSMGGYLALALWRRAPERVQALVLADTRAGADTPEAAEKRREMAASAMQHGDTAIVRERMLPGMLGRTTRRERPGVVATMEAMMARAGVPGAVDALEALRTRPDSSPTLATITVPTLVLCGDEDVLTPVEESRRLHEGIAGSRLAVIPGAGHASCLEAPEAFNALLSEFLLATIRTDLP